MPELQTVAVKKSNIIKEIVAEKIPKISSSAKQRKRQLLDFRSVQVQASWLKLYPLIEREVNKIIKNYKKEIVKDAEKLFQEFPSSALLPYKVYVEELKKFKPNDQDIISVRMSIYTYTGGAHGRKSYYYWNWSEKRKKFLSLDEVISSKQFTSLIRHTRRILFEQQKRGDEYDERRKSNIQSGVSKKEDFKVWNLNRNGIVFVFPEYQVAAYSEGSFEIYVPLDILQ